MIATLKGIRKHHPCAEWMADFLSRLGLARDNDELLRVERILDVAGLRSAVWSLRAVDGHDREIRIYAVRCAQMAYSIRGGTAYFFAPSALDVASRYARGNARQDEFERAGRAALRAAEMAEAKVGCFEPEAYAAALKVTDSVAVVAALVGTDQLRTAVEVMSAELRRVCQEIEAGRDPYPEEDGR